MKIALVSPSTEWPSDFARHRALIATALSDFEPVIDHIGSTSLGDIAAKPIIDIVVGVRDEMHLDAVVQPMLEAGYAYVKKFNAGMPYRRCFTKLVSLQPIPLPQVIGEDDTLSFGRHYNSVANVHVMKAGSHHWMRHIAFRDYLRAHPDARSSYEALKLGIAERSFDDPLDYNAFKDDFIAEHQEKAMTWVARSTCGNRSDRRS